MPSGSGSSGTYKSRWFLYPFLHFLSDIANIRDGVDSSTPTEAIIIQETVSVFSISLLLVNIYLLVTSLSLFCCNCNLL